jgi:lipopolysaccharide biosynthesis glycosyltransferase
MHDDIAIVTSADDKFAVGVAGTFKSLLQCLSPNRRLQLFVLDGGITSVNKELLVRHLRDERLTISWVGVDRKAVGDFVVSAHVSDATYYRLLAPELLPKTLKKFIYLDADMLILRDIGDMWDEPLDGAPCLAVQDPAAPYVDSEHVPELSEVARKHLANQRPIPNYQELGLAPASAYFNGGVMVVDLELWRRERLAERMLQVLHDHREHVIYWDQYALNVVLSERWKPLDLRWNQNSYILRLPGWQTTMFSREHYDRYVSQPWIAHFNWRKPWQAECRHPFADAFVAHLEGTPWHAPALEQRLAPPPREPAPPRKSKFKLAKEYVRAKVRGIRRGVYSWLSGKAA